MGPVSTTPQSRQLHDAAGRPIMGYVLRDTVVAEPWVGRPVRFFRPIERSYDQFYKRHILVKRASILFVGSDKWYESRKVFAKPAEGMSNVPLMIALRLTSHSWWMSKSGALERLATLYEERMPEMPPCEGWTLVSSETAESLIGYSRNTSDREVLPFESFTAKLDEALGKRRNIERALIRAKQALNRHNAALWVAQERVKKYEAKIADLKAKFEGILLPTKDPSSSS